MCIYKAVNRDYSYWYGDTYYYNSNTTIVNTLIMPTGCRIIALHHISARKYDMQVHIMFVLHVAKTTI